MKYFKYKYITHEELYDLTVDPMEKVNQIANPKYSSQVVELRKLLIEKKSAN